MLLILVFASFHLSRELHERMQHHIHQLHTYNELKDTAQMLMGKLASMEGTTTKKLYMRFDLNLDD